MSKKVLITQSNYIPWKGYFDAINYADELIIFDEMQYTRRDWRNRNKIVTPSGLVWLTIPVSVKGKFHQKINETRALDSRWREKHWKSILANYARAPFFKLYAEKFEHLYLGSDECNLSLINEQFIRTVNSILGIGTKITRCEQYGIEGDKNGRLIYLCKKVGASDYFSGASAKTYVDISRFKKTGIAVHWLDYSGYPQYKQLHEPFEHGVTVLDLLFNTGPEAKQYMKSFEVE